MKMASYNIRGLGGRIRRSAIRDLIKKEKVEFMCIQETKLENCDSMLCQSLWGGTDMD